VAHGQAQQSTGSRTELGRPIARLPEGSTDSENIRERVADRQLPRTSPDPTTSPIPPAFDFHRPLDPVPLPARITAC
jgi:hypothetical protein